MAAAIHDRCHHLQCIAASKGPSSKDQNFCLYSGKKGHGRNASARLDNHTSGFAVCGAKWYYPPGSKAYGKLGDPEIYFVVQSIISMYSMILLGGRGMPSLKSRCSEIESEAIS